MSLLDALSPEYGGEEKECLRKLLFVTSNKLALVGNRRKPNSSRRQPFQQPRSRLEPAIAQAVVQPIFLPLPELDHLGNDSKATPVGRPGHRTLWVLGY